VQIAQQIVKLASRKKDPEPVDDETWSTLIDLGKWAKEHGAYLGLVEKAIPAHNDKGSWLIVKHAAQAIMDSLTGRGSQLSDAACNK
jgi:hypothetical protein